MAERVQCERTTEVRYHTRYAVHGRHCERRARWRVITPDGEVLLLCTQHKKKLEEYWGGRATVEELD